MQATNDVISVGICSVVAAAICTAAREQGKHRGKGGGEKWGKSILGYGS